MVTVGFQRAGKISGGNNFRMNPRATAAIFNEVIRPRNPGQKSLPPPRRDLSDSPPPHGEEIVGGEEKNNQNLIGHRFSQMNTDNHFLSPTLIIRIHPCPKQFPILSTQGLLNPSIPPVNDLRTGCSIFEAIGEGSVRKADVRRNDLSVFSSSTAHGCIKVRRVIPDRVLGDNRP